MLESYLKDLAYNVLRDDIQRAVDGIARGEGYSTAEGQAMLDVLMGLGKLNEVLTKPAYRREDHSKLGQ